MTISLSSLFSATLLCYAMPRHALAISPYSRTLQHTHSISNKTNQMRVQDSSGKGAQMCVSACIQQVRLPVLSRTVDDLLHMPKRHENLPAGWRSSLLDDGSGPNAVQYREREEM